jgi:hypothetical protein
VHPDKIINACGVHLLTEKAAQQTYKVQQKNVYASTLGENECYLPSLKMFINYNPHSNSHFLFLHDYIAAIANWLK